MPKQKISKAKTDPEEGAAALVLQGHASLASLYSRPGFLFRRAHQIAVAVFANECTEVEITAPQHSSLFAIARCPGLNQSELARVLGFDRATMGQILAGLEARTLITRSRDAGAKRTITIDITDNGKALLSAVTPSMRRTTRRLLSPLNEDEREVLLGLVRKIVAALNEDTKSPIVSRSKRS